MPCSGYRPGSFEPSPAQLDSWASSQEDYGLPDIEAFLRELLVPLHRSRIAPFWMEATATPLGREPLSTADGDRHVDGGGATVRRSDGTPYREFPVSPVECARGLPTPCRLPSPDEWEWVCRGGTTSLFRWGDSCPSDEYPVAGAAFREHLRPNAFGLTIAVDPYDYEPTSDPTVAVGGDGGAMVCGGAGFLVGWLPLASAFRFDLGAPDDRVSGLHLRRCIPLHD